MSNVFSGAHILSHTLFSLGARRIFTVAGESYLAFLDAALDYPDFDLVTCRHESGAGFMAEAHGKLTGQPGICFVTRGPGICNASIAIHTAKQDSTPMLVFMGQVRREEKGREAFQEVDVNAVFGTLAKWTCEIEDPARIPELVQRAWRVAQSGRPGPVVIGLPEDMLRETTQIKLHDLSVDISGSVPTQQSVENVITALKSAQKPVCLLGGSGWSNEGIESFKKFAQAYDLPVITSLRRNDLYDHSDPNYCGELGFGVNPKLIEAVKESDCVLVVGARLNEIATQGYTLLGDPPFAHAKLIHVHQDQNEIGKIYTPYIGIACDPGQFAAQVVEHPISPNWQDWCAKLRQNYEDWSKSEPVSGPGWHGADMTQIFGYLQTHLPKDAIVTTDAGNFSGWAQRYFRYGRPGRLLAPTSGAMGYAVPSAVCASLAHPDRTVLGICGDGGFMMTASELATAMHHGAKPIILVCNNNMYGTIRMHQEQNYPGRLSATALTNPDFAAYAKSFGAFSKVVKRAQEFPDIWKEALNADILSVIEIKMDPRQISTQSVAS